MHRVDVVDLGPGEPDFPTPAHFRRDRALRAGGVLRVIVPDIQGYDAFYKKLIARINLTDVSSSFAMEQIKFTTSLPLDYAMEERRV